MPLSSANSETFSTATGIDVTYVFALLAVQAATVLGAAPGAGVGRVGARARGGECGARRGTSLYGIDIYPFLLRNCMVQNHSKLSYTRIRMRQESD